MNNDLLGTLLDLCCSSNRWSKSRCLVHSALVFHGTNLLQRRWINTTKAIPMTRRWTVFDIAKYESIVFIAFLGEAYLAVCMSRYMFDPKILSIVDHQLSDTELDILATFGNCYTDDH